MPSRDVMLWNLDVVAHSGVECQCTTGGCCSLTARRLNSIYVTHKYIVFYTWKWPSWNDFLNNIKESHVRDIENMHVEVAKTIVKLPLLIIVHVRAVRSEAQF